jgi:hypothetical protein
MPASVVLGSPPTDRDKFRKIVYFMHQYGTFPYSHCFMKIISMEISGVRNGGLLIFVQVSAVIRFLARRALG